MKQKAKTIGMLVLFMIVMFVSMISISTSSNAASTSPKHWGHKVYDSMGKWIGCELGGSECCFEDEIF